MRMATRFGGTTSKEGLAMTSGAPCIWGSAGNRTGNRRFWVLWAAPGGRETLQKGEGTSPPTFLKVSRPPGAAQTPKSTISGRYTKDPGARPGPRLQGVPRELRGSSPPVDHKPTSCISPYSWVHREIGSLLWTELSRNWLTALD